MNFGFQYIRKQQVIHHHVSWKF